MARHCVISDRWGSIKMKELTEHQDPDKYMSALSPSYSSVMFESKDHGKTWSVYKTKGVGAVQNILAVHKAYLPSKGISKPTKQYSKTEPIRYKVMEKNRRGSHVSPKLNISPSSKRRGSLLSASPSNSGLHLSRTLTALKGTKKNISSLENFSVWSASQVEQWCNNHKCDRQKILSKTFEGMEGKEIIRLNKADFVNVLVDEGLRNFVAISIYHEVQDLMISTKKNQQKKTFGALFKLVS